MYMKLGERIEILILYVAMCLVKRKPIHCLELLILQAQLRLNKFYLDVDNPSPLLIITDHPWHRLHHRVNLTRIDVGSNNTTNYSVATNADNYRLVLYDNMPFFRVLVFI